MTDRQERIDEFESMFKRAEREAFRFAAVPLRRIAVVTDGDVATAERLRESVRGFLSTIDADADWQLIVGEHYDDVAGLLQKLGGRDDDLIVASRHLQETALIPQHSLGVYLDVLTQATTVPVFVLPGTAGRPQSLDGRVCRKVMVVTDHISGDDRLINFGARMCPDGGELWLTHVEDDAVFERYMRAIEKIPQIDSATARERIGAQLLKEAGDFIETSRIELARQRPDLGVHAIVEQGHHLRTYRELVDAHDIDLLVANTKDAEQMAMHGMAYSLSVELVDVPLLLL